MIEISPRVISLGFHPRSCFSTLAILHPSVGVDDLLSEIGVGDFVHGCLGRPVLGRGTRNQQQNYAGYNGAWADYSHGGFSFTCDNGIDLKRPREAKQIETPDTLLMGR